MLPEDCQGSYCTPSKKEVYLTTEIMLPEDCSGRYCTLSKKKQNKSKLKNEL